MLENASLQADQVAHIKDSVKRFYDSLNHGDFETASKYVAPNVSIHNPQFQAAWIV